MDIDVPILENGGFHVGGDETGAGDGAQAIILRALYSPHLKNRQTHGDLLFGIRIDMQRRRRPRVVVLILGHFGPSLEGALEEVLDAVFPEAEGLVDLGDGGVGSSLEEVEEASEDAGERTVGGDGGVGVQSGLFQVFGVADFGALGHGGGAESFGLLSAEEEFGGSEPFVAGGNVAAQLFSQTVAQVLQGQSVMFIVVVSVLCLCFFCMSDCVEAGGFDFEEHIDEVVKEPLVFPLALAGEPFGDHEIWGQGGDGFFGSWWG